MSIECLHDGWNSNKGLQSLYTTKLTFWLPVLDFKAEIGGFVGEISLFNRKPTVDKGIIKY
jgi:hypothetical protein